MGKKNQKEYTEELLKEVEDSLRYLEDEGFVKKVGDRFFLKTEKEIDEEIKDVEKDN